MCVHRLKTSVKSKYKGKRKKKKEKRKRHKDKSDKFDMFSKARN